MDNITNVAKKVASELDLREIKDASNDIHAFLHHHQTKKEFDSFVASVKDQQKKGNSIFLNTEHVDGRDYLLIEDIEIANRVTGSPTREVLSIVAQLDGAKVQQSISFKLAKKPNELVDIFNDFQSKLLTRLRNHGEPIESDFIQLKVLAASSDKMGDSWQAYLNREIAMGELATAAVYTKNPIKEYAQKMYEDAVKFLDAAKKLDDSNPENVQLDRIAKYVHGAVYPKYKKSK